MTSAQSWGFAWISSKTCLFRRLASSDRSGSSGMTDTTDYFMMYDYSQTQTLNGFYAEDEYRQGQYIFGNIFYSVTPRFKIAGEYLYGTRENMSGVESHANRVNMLLQYSF